MATSQVILTEAISSLGAEADIVKVRSGYARNFLVPHGKALEVTPAALRKLDHLKAKRVEREARELNEAEIISAKINKLHFMMKLDTGIQGKTFGSITANDLIERLALELKDLVIPRHAIVLDRPIKESGEKNIPVRLHPDIVTTLRITVEALPKVERAGSDEGDEEEGGYKKRRSRRDEAVEVSS